MLKLLLWDWGRSDVKLGDSLRRTCHLLCGTNDAFQLLPATQPLFSCKNPFGYASVPPVGYLCLDKRAADLFSLVVFFGHRSNFPYSFQTRAYCSFFLSDERCECRL